MKCGLCCEIWGVGVGVAQREGFTHIPLSAFAFLGEVAVVSVSPFTLLPLKSHMVTCAMFWGAYPSPKMNRSRLHF